MGIARIGDTGAVVSRHFPETVPSEQDEASHAGSDDARAASQAATPTLAQPGLLGGDIDRHAIRASVVDRLHKAAASGPLPEASAAAATSASTRAIAPAAQAAELERLQSSLAQWVDEEKAQAYKDRPSDLLRAVAKQHHRSVPDAFAETLDVTLLADEAVLDEAAVLDERLTPRVTTGAGKGAAPVSLSALRGRFLDRLSADYVKRSALDALFVPSPAPGQSAPYFDGFALRNAEGKSFDDLVATQAVWSHRALSSLTAQERRALLAEKFDEMAESRRFPIGTVPHSLATALLRSNRYVGASPSDSGDEAALVKAFRDAEGAWKGGESYPFHPRLLFAMHLAKSSGIDVMSHDQLRLVYENEVSDPALERMAAGDDVPELWIDSYLSRSSQHGARWREAKPEQQTQLLLGLFDALREAADHPSPVSDFARALRAKGVLASGHLIGGDFEARAKAVLGYANERLLAAYGAPPAFDRREAARSTLLRHGVDEAVLSDARRYTISADNLNITKETFGDLVDEFLDRADWIGLTGAWMTLPTGARLNPKDELQRDEEAFNARLPANAWVIATAKERLRLRAKPMTREAVQREADDVAAGARTETESHRALMRGLETWVNTIPVVGPVYNIEEGVRHRDAVRAAFGLLFLGADLFDLSAGAGGGARSGAVHPIVPKLRRVAGRIDASGMNAAGHPDIFEMSVDPVHIAQRDADVPVALRPLARRAREGSSVRWSNYDVVHLEEEDRIVPVHREDDRYVEVDWRTGHRLRDAPSIELDAQTGKARAQSIDSLRGHRTEYGGDVRERLTVKSVTRLLRRANDRTLRDFDGMFADAFAFSGPVAANTSQFNARTFYRKVYESSETFRMLFNRHAKLDALEQNGTASLWKRWEFVVGHSGSLGAPRKAYTDFEHKRIYVPEDARIEATPYATAGGPRQMSPEQVYLGEMVRALTGARDPAGGLDLTNRGPTIYLSDKILSEAGYEFPPRIVSREQSARPDMPHEEQETIEYHADAAARDAEREDRYLDALIDAERAPATAATLVEGVPVSSRPTVVGAKEVLDAIEGEKDELFLTWSDFKTKFDENFGFYVQDRTMTRELASDAMVVMNFYVRLYRRSATFRRMFDHMPVTDVSRAAPWKFVLEGDIEFDSFSRGANARGTVEQTKKIYVLDDGVRYLTDAGLREVEIERQLTHQMICAMMGLRKLPPAQAPANRGAAVYLADRVLAEAGFHYPRQLVAALAGADDAAAQARLLARQTSAMRSAATEDQYLMLA